MDSPATSHGLRTKYFKGDFLVHKNSLTSETFLLMVGLNSDRTLCSTETNLWILSLRDHWYSKDQSSVMNTKVHTMTLTLEVFLLGEVGAGWMNFLKFVTILFIFGSVWVKREQCLPYQRGAYQSCFDIQYRWKVRPDHHCTSKKGRQACPWFCFNDQRCFLCPPIYKKRSGMFSLCSVLSEVVRMFLLHPCLKAFPFFLTSRDNGRY